MNLKKISYASIGAVVATVSILSTTLMPLTASAAACLTYVSSWTAPSGTGAGQLLSTFGIASVGGDVYIADTTVSPRIARFTPSGTYVGQFSVTDGAYGMTRDASGNLYVAGYSAVRKYTTSGTLSQTFGSSGTGDGQFSYAWGVGRDSAGNIFVADPVANRVQKFDSAGTFLAKWGSPGTGDGQFNYADNVAVDSLGNVYVTDHANHTVQKFDNNGNFLTKWSVTEATGIAIDASDIVYVSTSGNRYVYAYTTTGTLVGSSINLAQLPFPEGLAVDGSGSLLVVSRQTVGTLDISACGVAQTPTPTLTPTPTGTPAPTGDYKDILTFSLQTMGKGPARFDHITGAQLRVFNTDDAAFKAAYGNGYGQYGSKLNLIYNGGIGQISFCTTDGDGACTALKTAAGNYLVVGRYDDSANNQSVYVSETELVNSFTVDKEAYADLKVQVFYQNGAFKKYGSQGVVTPLVVASSGTGGLLISIAGILLVAAGLAAYARMRNTKKA